MKSYKKVGNYLLLNEIGSGSFSKVYRVRKIGEPEDS